MFSDGDQLYSTNVREKQNKANSPECCKQKQLELL
jgi:hypothetical protein